MRLILCLVAIAGCGSKQPTPPVATETTLIGNQYRAETSSELQTTGENEVAVAIRALPNPYSSTWDEDVKVILLEHYDLDESGSISADELDNISCDVMQALDGEKQHVAITYGFGPHLAWVGSELGFDEESRPQVLQLAERCGLETVTMP